MNGDREWNDRLRPDEVETVPAGRPLRDIIVLTAAAAGVAVLLSRWPAPRADAIAADLPAVQPAHAVARHASVTAARVAMPHPHPAHRALTGGRALPGD
jgi:hypothetical protein